MTFRPSRMKMLSLLAATAGACLLLSGCTDNPQSEAQSAGPTEYGPMLRGVPVESFTCAALIPDRPFDYVRFQSVSGLLACGSELPTTGIGIPASDPGFSEVLTALSAKDVNRPWPCPAPIGRTWSLPFLASASGQAYIVRVPRGGCGAIQPDLSHAVKVAGIQLKHYPQSG
ncbi:MAG: hypothetical protein ABI586_02445 [Candidatus Nanopelagicales bacterium]